MSYRLKHSAGWFLLLAGIVCFAGCGDPLEDGKSGAGTGTIRIDLAQGSRTAMPENLEITKYVLTFTQGETTVKTETTDKTVLTLELEAGDYTLNAAGYMNDNKAIVSATVQVSIIAYQDTLVRVPLSFIQNSSGTFTYTVSYPETFIPETVRLRFTSVSGGTDQELDLRTAGLRGSQSLSGGSYQVTLELYGKIGDMNKFAGKIIAAHIYEDLETSADFTFTADHFKDSSSNFEATSAEEFTAALIAIQNDPAEECTILITEDFSLDPVSFDNIEYTGKTITIKSKGTSPQEISLNSTGALFTVGSETVAPTLILENITLRGITDNTYSLVRVNGGTLKLGSDGTITGNTASSGGGVFVDFYGTFEMQGGTISGNTASSGGGVYVFGGRFEMQGGTINGNTASSSYDSSGGGVHVGWRGTFEMQGGTISGNTVSSSSRPSYGGGVFVYSSGSFTKAPPAGGSTSGVIYGSDAEDTLKNTASYSGWAVYYESSPVRQRNTTAGETVSLSTASNDNWME